MHWVIRFSVVCLSITLAACVTEQQATREGTKAFDQMRQEMVETNNAATRSYVNCIARAIVAEIGPPYDSLDWEVVVFEEQSVNAFALPGGKIGVHTGILSVAKTTDQLAAVIGHEVAHVTEQHSVERMNRAMAANVGVTVADIFNPNAGTAAGLLAQYGLLLPYGRSQESEADVVGLRYMAKAGFDPRASKDLWKNMEEANSGAPPEFLSTHPSTSTRIADLIAQYPETLVIFNEARAQGKRPACRRP